MAMEEVVDEAVVIEEGVEDEVTVDVVEGEVWKEAVKLLMQAIVLGGQWEEPWMEMLPVSIRMMMMKTTTIEAVIVEVDQNTVAIATEEMMVGIKTSWSPRTEYLDYLSSFIIIVVIFWIQLKLKYECWTKDMISSALE